MTWEKIRDHYPHQWLLIEALKAHSCPGKRIVEDISVVDSFPDSTKALHNYAKRKA